MQSAGLSYEEAFGEADRLGYLEADPTLDVGGIDAAHKLSLLAATAFGCKVDFASVEIEGIERVTADDIRSAADLGYRIKLLCAAQMTEAGLEQRTSPCLVPADSPGRAARRRHQHGRDRGRRGRAGGPARPRRRARSDGKRGDGRRRRHRPGVRTCTFGAPADALAEPRPAKTATPAAHYLRMLLRDEPGALAKVAAVLGEAGVSIDRMRQHRHDDRDAPVTIVTHPTPRAAVDAALAGAAGLAVVSDAPLALRIEAL